MSGGNDKLIRALRILGVDLRSPPPAVVPLLGSIEAYATMTGDADLARQAGDLARSLLASGPAGQG